MPWRKAAMQQRLHRGTAGEFLSGTVLQVPTAAMPAN
jgi:hypothetical protein